MLRNSFSKKLGLLALAPLALAVGSVHAGGTCTNANLSVWSATSTLGGTLTVADGGLGGTACRLDTQLTLGAPGVNAFVRDNSPSDEPRYRAQFIVNVDALTGLNSIQTVRLLGVVTENANLGIGEVVRLSVQGNIAGTTKSLGIRTVCSEAASGLCTATTALAPGENRIEIDWERGAAGALRVWVNSNTDATPTTTVSANSAAWGGVDFIALGLAVASPQFRTTQLNRVVQFDEFDSRRQSFIGF